MENREIDALIAEKVMVWVWATDCGPWGHWHRTSGIDQCLGSIPWHPSTDPAASAQVRERMRELGWSVSVEAGPTGPTKAFFWKADTPGSVYSAQDDLEGRAVGLAALKTAGVEVEA